VVEGATNRKRQGSRPEAGSYPDTRRPECDRSGRRFRQKGVALLAASHWEVLCQISSWTCNGAIEARAAWRCQQSLIRRGAVRVMMGDDICLIHEARMMRAREGTKKPFDRIVGRMATVACKSDELLRGESHLNERKF
jgi:hypothetical protein